MTPRSKVLLSLCVLIGVFWAGVVGYVVIDGASLFDAVYMVSITLSTVGFGEAPWLSPLGRVWTVFVIIFGIAAVLTAFASLQAAIIGGELRRLMGRRKLQNKINQLRDHIIICGYGRMGALVTSELHAKNIPVVVIDNDRSKTQMLDESGLLYILGPAEEEETLVQAGGMSAKGIVTCLNDDASNVFVTLTARSVRDTLLIVARAEMTNSVSKLERAGANRVICPQVIGARRITNMLIRPALVDFIDVAAQGLELEVDEHVIGAHSSLCGKRLQESGLRERGGTVVAIKRQDGATIYGPPADTELQSNDTLILIGRKGMSSRINEK